MLEDFVSRLGGLEPSQEAFVGTSPFALEREGTGTPVIANSNYVRAWAARPTKESKRSGAVGELHRSFVGSPRRSRGLRCLRMTIVVIEMRGAVDRARARCWGDEGNRNFEVCGSYSSSGAACGREPSRQAFVVPAPSQRTRRNGAPHFIANVNESKGLGRPPWQLVSHWRAA